MPNNDVLTKHQRCDIFVERDKTTNTPGFGRMNVNRENNGPPKQMKGIFFDGERQRIRGFLAVGAKNLSPLPYCSLPLKITNFEN
jgi:hypothetical protein